MYDSSRKSEISDFVIMKSTFLESDMTHISPVVKITIKNNLGARKFLFNISNGFVQKYTSVD